MAAAVEEADRAFAEDSRVRGADAWADIWSAQGRLMPAEGAQGDGVVGPDAVRAAVTESLGPDLRRMRWEPEASGAWWEHAAWTTGRWWLEPEGGGEPTDEGRYFTAWTLESGEWKVALDASIPDCTGSDAARDFDFWARDWSVAQRIRAGGGWEEYPARSVVSRIADGCALVEHWAGTVRFEWEQMQQPVRMRAGSVRIFDAGSGTWRIQWLDERAPSFAPGYVGSFDGTVGTFVNTGGAPTRIIFDQVATDTVDWRLETRLADAWAPIWTMRFTPR